VLVLGIEERELYCPKCKTECSESVSRCHTCGAVLVDSLESTVEPENDLVTLFKTPDIGLLMVVKSVLESAGISYVVQGEEGLHVFPLGSSAGFFNPSAFGAVIRVCRKDLSDARKLLEETVPPASDPDGNDS
jgi:hypothetical protein